MAFQEPKDIIQNAQTAFMESVVKNLKLELIRRVITTPVIKGVCFPAYDDYADYRNLTEVSAVETARELGSGCAVLYNSLVQNAERTRKHKVVTDLFADNNLRFNVVLSAEPSVADPAAMIKGWVSFRFYFLSSNERPQSLSTAQPTLSVVQERSRY